MPVTLERYRSNRIKVPVLDRGVGVNFIDCVFFSNIFKKCSYL